MLFTCSLFLVMLLRKTCFAPIQSLEIGIIGIGPDIARSVASQYGNEKGEQETFIAYLNASKIALVLDEHNIISLVINVLIVDNMSSISRVVPVTDVWGLDKFGELSVPCMQL